MAVYFYTETAFHHEGSTEFLFDLIRTSKHIGANGIKFQVLIDYDELISSRHPSYTTFKKALISKSDWVRIFNYCGEIGIDIVYMPCDRKAVDLVLTLDVLPTYIDIHSVSFNDYLLLNEIKNTGIPVILGAGGRYPNEIEEKFRFFGNQLKVLMIGFQGFPTLVEDVVLERISYYKSKYPRVEIGYADHSETGSADSIASNDWAYILGARYFEKHITTMPHIERFDWQSASSIEDIESIIKRLRRLDSIILNRGDNELTRLADSELKYRNREKYALASARIPAGTILTKNMLVFKMTGGSVGINKVDFLVGKRLINDKDPDEPILHSDLEL